PFELIVFIHVHEDHAVVNDGRMPRAVLADEAAERLRPQFLAGQGVSEQRERVAVPRDAVDPLAVRGWSRRGQGVVRVRLGFLAGEFLGPERLALGRIQAQQYAFRTVGAGRLEEHLAADNDRRTRTL